MSVEGLYQFHGDKYDARIKISGTEVYAVITRKEQTYTHLLKPEAKKLLDTLIENTDGVPVELQGFIIDSVCENSL